VINRREGRFDSDDEDTLSGIAAAASAALVNAQHYQDMWQLTESGLRTMAAMLDARDRHTSGHTERVAKTAELIGRRLGFTPGELASLRVAAAVHDFGKLSVPEVVLNKPGRLTDEEMALVQDHVEVTRWILGRFDFPEPLADVPRIACEHHERLDGLG
jgi:HD-GYP domain-containing protein (c-di-GMP phosphodiesterase class II)